MFKFSFHTLVFIFLCLSAPKALADIWDATNEWDMQWESKFANWMRSARVQKNLFTSPSSPYYGIKADCADASYALRAIFAMENSLPFKVANPSGSRGAFNYLSNELTKFDRYRTKERRLVAFINYLGLQVGTEHLNHYDTVPVKIDSITPGMIFTYKIKRFTGKVIRHSYNIKDITPTGNFDVIYSTQAIAKKDLPMMYRKEYMFSNAPSGVWGFKRFKWPRLQGIAMNRYPADYSHSSEQFALVGQFGARRFFRHVKKTLQVQEETPQGLLTRSLNTLCTMANDRITYVNQGLDHHRQTGGRCMNYADYDAYSTPARDKALKEAYLSLFANAEDVEMMNQINEVDDTLWSNIQAIKEGAHLSTEEDLLKACSINYRTGVTIHLAELYRRLKADLLSSHPNDNIQLRWGETSRGGTNCRVWY